MPSKNLLQGRIISDKMTKTVVVKATLLKTHPKYRKKYRVYRRYKAHDERGEYHTGDIVEIQETRPMSKEKRWKVVRKIK